VRFYLDHDVPAQVCSDVLTPAGHDCWTANNAGLALEQDDDQTVYATDRDAVLVSYDSEFSQRRRRNAIGQHARTRSCTRWPVPWLRKHPVSAAGPRLNSPDLG